MTPLFFPQQRRAYFNMDFTDGITGLKTSNERLVLSTDELRNHAEKIGLRVNTKIVGKCGQ